MKPKLIYLLSLFFISHFASAQTPVTSYYKKMKELTKELDTTSLKNNILYDRVYPLAKLDGFNQNQRIDTSNVVHFKQAVNELFLASNKRAEIFNSEKLKQVLYDAKVKNKIAIGVLNADFTILNPLALDPANLLITTDGVSFEKKYHNIENKNSYNSKQALVIGILEEQINQGTTPVVLPLTKLLLKSLLIRSFPCL